MGNKTWQGASGLCLNEHGELLMVKQGKPDEEKLWSVPSGGKEDGETFEECCIREVYEETGYEVEIIRPYHVKKGFMFGYDVTVQYFVVRVIGGSIKIQDPDQLIHDIQWKTASEIMNLELSFPEDRNLLLKFIEKVN